ncbi:MAG: M16 family metallopeptidase [Gammaproteobacteria bacterium]
MRSICLLLAGLALVAPPCPAETAKRTHEFTLDNGLELIVQEDHRAPVAVVQVWYRVGSAYEHDGITGVSHALEHMMFKDTKSLATGEFSRIVASRGGRENAFTSTDYTAYFQQWAAGNVEESFRLEAERMANLVISDEEFAKEINVVLEERRLRTDDNPQALASEATQAVAFQTGPYRQPIIGWEADIQQMTAADIRQWYQRWYGPNNATLVVVGDVEPQAVHALAVKHFGALPAREILPPKARPEVSQHGTKRVTYASDRARNPYLVMGFKVPVLSAAVRDEAIEEWEIYALDVLAETLDGDDSARLSRNLVRGRELASHIDAGFSATAMLPTLFYFNAVPRDGVALADLERAILTEIEALKQSPPAAAELERIKTQVVADTVFERDSMMHQAIIIGSLESVGLDWRLRDEYVDKIRAVTPEQVQAVAAKYFVPDGLTVSYLLPETES